MWTDILTGLANATTPEALIANAIGVALGIVFGALPGLTAAMGVALLMPLTFNMPTTEAFSALLGMYCGAIYGGCITAILVGTPGTVAAAATMLEGPALTARGESKKALDMATMASFFGGVFSCIALMTVAPLLAKAATAFNSADYFAVAVFGMTVVASLASSAMLKGGIAALLGLYISTIGGDPISGELRNTFNMPDLFGGLAQVPVLVGLFAVAQIFVTIEEYFTKTAQGIKIEISKKGLSLGEFWKYKFNMLRSSVIGTIVGIIPATGVGTASYIAYSSARRNSKTPEMYGKGTLEGIAATESANNAVTGGALIPLLTLGVPGDVVTAVMLGALMIQGMTPGPLLFHEQGTLVYSIFISLFIANIFMLVLGYASVRLLAKIVLIPGGILMPLVTTLCVVGGYALNNSNFDLAVMLGFGFLGYVMTKAAIPLAPLLLAMILSGIIETNFRRALSLSNNDFSVFFTRPVCAAFLAISVFIVLNLIRKEIRQHRAARQTAA